MHLERVDVPSLFGDFEVRQLSPLESAYQALFQGMRDDAYGTAHSMSNAFEGFFATMFAGFGEGEDVFATFAAATQGLGREMVQNLTEGFAQWQMAEGAIDLAGGAWPPNPAQLAAAGLHFAAAGALRALGSMIGSGGGRASAPTYSTRDPGLGAAQGADRRGAEVHIYIDPLNPKDPVYQRNVHAAQALARERYGSGAEITVHPRTGSGA